MFYLKMNVIDAIELTKQITLQNNNSYNQSTYEA